MTSTQPLQGSCSCGRYSYMIVIPEDAQEKAQVHFRTDDEHRRSQAALLTAFLRIPLSWYSSNTNPYFPDEDHRAISRTFSPLNEPHCQRKFCGFCGTHLSYWTEEPREEQEYLHITIGSLGNNALSVLEDLDLLPDDIDIGEPRDARSTPSQEASLSTATNSQPGEMVRTTKHGRDGPMTWFEEMMDGSQLGRTRKTRRGIGTTADGSTSVTWEVTEFADDDEDVVMTAAPSVAKRKHDDVAGDDKS